MGTAIFAKVRRYTELSNGSVNGEVFRTRASRTGFGTRDASRAATATPATPNTVSSPKVSNARNSTRITLTRLLPPVTSVPCSVRYCAGSDMPRRPVSAKVPANAAIPAAMTAIMPTLDGFSRSPKFFGSRCNSSTMTTMVRISTSNWVRATSTAPRAKNHSVTPKPTVPKTAMAPTRVLARIVASTPTATTATSNQSVQRVRFSCCAGSSSIVNQPTNTSTMSKIDGTARCRPGLSPEVQEPTIAPRSMVACRSFSTAPSPEKVSGRGTRNASSDGRYQTARAPTPITISDNIRAGVMPCHSDKWTLCSAPIAELAAAATVSDNTNGTTPRINDKDAFTAGYPQNAIEPSRTVCRLAVIPRGVLIQSLGDGCHPMAHRTSLPEYANVQMAMSTTSAVSPTVTAVGRSASRNAWKSDSLETKPSSGGTPAMEAAPKMTTVRVAGMAIFRTVSMRMSRVPASWSMTPTARKSADLNRACAMVCKTAAVSAVGVPMPINATKYPS